MALQTEGTIVDNRHIQSIYYLLEIHVPPIANQVQPGQFIMLKTSETPYPLLRRPFSVYRRFPEDHPEKRKRGRISLLYKKVGKGTQNMTKLRKGQKVDILGPLGKGFTLSPHLSSASVVLIGGGVGIVSLYPLAEALQPQRLFVFIGGKGKEDILCVKELKQCEARIFIATEDGSLGFKGTVMELFRSQKKRLEKYSVACVYACGPLGMLQELARGGSWGGIPCQISMEARMGCGFGACWGCVVKTKDPITPYHRVCREGPVFDLGEIAFES